MTQATYRVVLAAVGHECLSSFDAKVFMRFLLAALMLIVLQQSDAPRVRLLLRDESDAGVAVAMLNLRTANGETLLLTTDANGVAVSSALAGDAVWLMSGQRADGHTLLADSYPASAGFRLVLIPGQVRDVLLRLDGDRIVLDPDMIFSPGDPGEIVPSTPPQLATIDAPLSPASSPIGSFQSPISPDNANIASTPAVPADGGSALSIVLAIVAAGVFLLVLALLVGLARRRQA